MADDQNIDQLFQGAFENFEAKPDARIWDEIADQSAFDAQIQHAFSAFETAPNPSIWENISQAQNFDEQVRNSMNGLEVQPLPEVWAAVASHPLETKMRQTLKNYEQEPAASNWEEIKRGIPFTMVFLRNNMVQLSRIAAVLVLGLLLSLGLSDLTWPKADDNGFANNIPPVKTDEPCLNGNPSPLVLALAPTIEVREDNATNMAAILPKTSSTTPPKAKNKNTATPLLVSNKKDAVATRPPVQGNFAPSQKTAGNLLAANTIQRKKYITEEIQPRESFIPMNGIEMPSVNKNNRIDHESASFSQVTSAFGANELESVEDFQDIIKNNKLVSRTDNSTAIQALNYRGLYVIGAAQYGFNWLYNEALRSKLSEIVETDYVIDFGGSAGLGIGFLLSPRVGIEAQWNYSRINQSYQEHVPDGLFLYTETKLTYSSFPVVMKVQLNRLKNNRRVPMTSSFALGAQYRYLRKTNVQANVEIERSQFIEKEIGAVIGYDVNLHMSKNVFLTIGGRASVGTDVDDLSNLSKDGRFNTEVGLRMAVNYKLKR